MSISQNIAVMEYGYKISLFVKWCCPFGAVAMKMVGEIDFFNDFKFHRFNRSHKQKN